MTATTRWVLYDTTSSGTHGDGRAAGCKGTRGYSIGTTDPGDVITIGATTNRLYFSLDGDVSPPAAYITVYSGTGLDPRFVARDISEKIHDLSTDERYANAICTWENVTVGGGATNCNRFVLRCGTLGSASSAVVVISGTNTAHAVLGFATKSEVGGSANPDGKASYTFAGTVSVSGTYKGLFDDVYKVVISNDNHAVRGIGTPTKDGANSYSGTMTTGGVFNNTADLTYVIEIDVTNGTTMGAGTGNVPLMSWTSTGSADNSTADVELLYPNYWYYVGTKGLMVRFTDAVFNSCNPAWTIICSKPDYAQGTNASAAVGTAEYIWSSMRGDMSSAVRGTTVSGGYTALGTAGLYVMFNATGYGDDLGAGDCFYVLCKGVQPSSYNITSLNYGNVTVSTESAVKSVMFEIESGAAELSSVKFGLQSHGTFVHHDAGNDDTYFRFGTVGPTNTASGIEWYPNIVAGDIDSDIPPSYLYATKENLAVVATADLSESIGAYPRRGMTSDPVWLGIRLGSSETGANSTLNYRLYFDYS